MCVDNNMKYTCHLGGFIGLSYKWVESILLHESLDLLGMNTLVCISLYIVYSRSLYTKPKKSTETLGNGKVYNRWWRLFFLKNVFKKSSYRCFASEGATRQACIWMILKGERDNLFSWQFWRNYVSISGLYDLEVVTRRPFFRLIYRDYEMILGFDYFEWVSEWSWVLRTLKESKTKHFCLWTDSADFLTQSPIGDVDVKYQEPLRDAQSKFELWNTLSELKEAMDGPAG